MRLSKRLLVVILAVLAGIWAAVLLSLPPRTPGTELSLDQVQAQARGGRIRDVTLLIEDGRLAGTSTSGPYWADIGRGEILPSDAVLALAQQGVTTRVDVQLSKRLLNIAAQYILPVVTLGMIFLVFFGIARGSRNEADYGGLGRSRARQHERGRIQGPTFDDIAGLDEAVEELREVRDHLTSPRSYARLGAKLPKGVLLVGPPGCGKTLLVQALASEASAGFFSASASEFVEMLAGVGAARVRDLFVQARAVAPSIVFVDELDAIGRARAAAGSTTMGEYETTLNELLVQLDGFDPDRRVLFIAATNRLDMLDPALLRKGRFDRQIVIDHPDLQGRLAIFRIHARGKPIAPEVALESFARRTPGFTGADIAATMNEAALLAARRGSSLVGASEISESIDRVTAGPQRRSRILSAEERRRVAYHEGGHALVGWLLNRASSVERVSIVARGHVLGHTMSLPDDDRRLMTRSQLLEELTASLAGYAAEEIALSDPSTGAQNDLLRATWLARQMVCEFGMSEALGPLILSADGSDLTARLPHSGPTAEAADREVRRLLDEADRRARDTLAAHRETLDRFAEELVARETLERPDIEALLRSVPEGLPADQQPHPAGTRVPDRPR